MSEIQPNEPPPDWAVLPNVRLVLESNMGGYPVDVCARCGAVVPVEFRQLHSQSHTMSMFGMGF